MAASTRPSTRRCRAPRRLRRRAGRRRRSPPGAGCPRTVRELIDRAPLLGRRGPRGRSWSTGSAYRDEVYAELRGRRPARTRAAALRLPLQPPQGWRERIPRPAAGRRRADPGAGADPARAAAARSPLPGQSRDRVGHDRGGVPRRGQGRQGQGDRVPHRQPRRLVRRLRHDLARGRPRPPGRQAGDRLDGQRRRVRRLLRRRSADTIVAQPGTLTGSIGVVFGKPVSADLLDRLGIGLGTVEHGRARPHVSPDHATSPRRSGRGSTPSSTGCTTTSPARSPRAAACPANASHELARGRVWTGADAHERGLVDELGGLACALELARKKAGLAVGRRRVRVYPHVSPLDRLRPAESSEDRTAASARLGRLGADHRRARLGRPPGPAPAPAAGAARRSPGSLGGRSADGGVAGFHRRARDASRPASWSSTVRDGRDDIGTTRDRVLLRLPRPADGAGRRRRRRPTSARCCTAATAGP